MKQTKNAWIYAIIGIILMIVAFKMGLFGDNQAVFSSSTPPIWTSNGSYSSCFVGGSYSVDGNSGTTAYYNLSPDSCEIYSIYEFNRPVLISNQGVPLSSIDTYYSYKHLNGGNTQNLVRQTMTNGCLATDKIKVRMYVNKTNNNLTSISCMVGSTWLRMVDIPSAIGFNEVWLIPLYVGTTGTETVDAEGFQENPNTIGSLTLLDGFNAVDGSYSTYITLNASQYTKEFRGTYNKPTGVIGAEYWITTDIGVIKYNITPTPCWNYTASAIYPKIAGSNGIGFVGACTTGITYTLGADITATKIYDEKVKWIFAEGAAPTITAPSIQGNDTISVQENPNQVVSASSYPLWSNYSNAYDGNYNTYAERNASYYPTSIYYVARLRYIKPTDAVGAIYSLRLEEGMFNFTVPTANFNNGLPYLDLAPNAYPAQVKVITYNSAGTAIYLSPFVTVPSPAKIYDERVYWILNTTTVGECISGATQNITCWNGPMINRSCVNNYWVNQNPVCPAQVCTAGQTLSTSCYRMPNITTHTCVSNVWIETNNQCAQYILPTTILTRYLSKFNNPLSTNVSALTVMENVADFRAQNMKGFLQFKQPINLFKDTTFIDEYITIIDNKVIVDSVAMPELSNIPARICLNDINYKNPRLLRDGEPCPKSICTDLLYDNVTNTLCFDVIQWSEYSVEETPISEVPTVTGGGGGGGGSGSVPRLTTTNLQESEVNTFTPTSSWLSRLGLDKLGLTDTTATIIIIVIIIGVIAILKYKKKIWR